MNTATLDLPRTLHPTRSIAEAAGSGPLKPYQMPPADTRSTLEILAKDRSRAHVTSRVQAKKLASFAGALAGGKFIEAEERDILLSLQKKCEELIALMHYNDNDVIRRRFDEQRAKAARGELTAAQIGKTEGSLESALDEARRVRMLCSSSLERILQDRIRPMAAVIAARVLVVVEAAAEATIKELLAVWAKHEIPYEESELERALRDRVTAIRSLVDTRFAGLSGDVTPRAALAMLDLTL